MNINKITRILKILEFSTAIEVRCLRTLLQEIFEYHIENVPHAIQIYKGLEFIDEQPEGVNELSCLAIMIEDLAVRTK